MQEKPKKGDWLLAAARELFRKVKKGRIIWQGNEETIFEAGRLAGIEEQKQAEKPRKT